jgi:hypothetical protein
MSYERVESGLRDLAAHLEWPTEVDVAVSPRPVRSRRLAWALALGTSLLLVLALVPAGRDAIASLARVVGIRIEFREPPTDVGQGLRLGTALTPEEAAAEVDFELVAPSQLEPPDSFYVQRLAAGPQVWLAWEPSTELPVIPETNLGLLLTQFRADPGEESIVKLASAGIQVIRADVNGEQGYWLTGGPHRVEFNFGDFVDASRSTGNVLLWTEGPITYRMETALNLPEALELARNLIPLD